MASLRFSKQLFQKKNIVSSSSGCGAARALSSVVGNATGKANSSLTSKYTIGTIMCKYTAYRPSYHSILPFVIIVTSSLMF